jgi:hypothetical protein
MEVPFGSALILSFNGGEELEYWTSGIIGTAGVCPYFKL